jgi:hypothetical protein
MCFVWIWEQTAIISLYCINWNVCITEMESVYCAVRAGYLNVNQVKFSSWQRRSITHSAMTPCCHRRTVLLVLFGKLRNVVSDELAVSIFRTSSRSLNVDSWSTSTSSDVWWTVLRFSAASPFSEKIFDRWCAKCEQSGLCCPSWSGDCWWGLNCSYCHGPLEGGGVIYKCPKMYSIPMVDIGLWRMSI